MWYAFVRTPNGEKTHAETALRVTGYASMDEAEQKARNYSRKSGLDCFVAKDFKRNIIQFFRKGEPLPPPMP